MLNAIQGELVKNGVEVRQAHRGAEAAIRAVSREFGGRVIYLPKGQGLELALRNGRIWSDFTFSDCEVPTLATRYRLSETQIRNVLKEQERLHQE